MPALPVRTAACDPPSPLVRHRQRSCRLHSRGPSLVQDDDVDQHHHHHHRRHHRHLDHHHRHGPGIASHGCLADASSSSDDTDVQLPPTFRHSSRQQPPPPPLVPRAAHPSAPAAAIPPASPEVISSLITSLAVLSTANDAGRLDGPASQSLPTTPGSTSSSFGVDYGAYNRPGLYRSPAHPVSLDDLAACLPVVRTVKHSSSFSARAASNNSVAGLRSFIRAGSSTAASRPSSRGSLASKHDDAHSIGNLSVEPGAAQTPDLAACRSHDSWGSKANNRPCPPRGPSSRERLRIHLATRMPPMPSSKPTSTLAAVTLEPKSSVAKHSTPTPSQTSPSSWGSKTSFPRRPSLRLPLAGNCPKAAVARLSWRSGSHSEPTTTITAHLIPPSRASGGATSTAPTATTAASFPAAGTVPAPATPSKPSVAAPSRTGRRPGLTRYITAFYDELASTLKLSLITPDQPGVGDSEPYSDGTATPLSWPDDVYAICQALRITKFSILAHSAGAIYALVTALRMPQHIRGRIHLLAPWILPSQMNFFGSTQAMPPTNAIPTSQKILRALPTPILKAANSSFMTVTSSSITSSLPKNARRTKRKTHGKDVPVPPMLDADNVAHEGYTKDGDSIFKTLAAAETINDLRPAGGDVDVPAAKECQMTYDTRLTHGIWELATTGANPAVDLLVCLERRHSIDFRYVDITRPVVIHHGSHDTRAGGQCQVAGQDDAAVRSTRARG